MNARLVVLGSLVAGCAAPPRPTVTGAALYAQVQALQAGTPITVDAGGKPLEVRRDQALISDTQAFEIAQLVEHCHGGVPEADVDCTLALLRDQRFRVVDRIPRRAEPSQADERLAFRIKGIVVTTLLAVPLIYGVHSCSTPGCQALFGVPLVFDGLALVVFLAGGLR